MRTRGTVAARMTAFAAVLTSALLLAGCGGTATPEDTSTFTGDGSGPAPVTAAPVSDAAAETGGPRVVGTVASGLEVPWGVAFLPDGSALVTERDSGRVLHVVPRSNRAAQVSVAGRLDETAAAGGEAGLLGVAVSPDFAKDRRAYFYVTTDEDNRIVSAPFRDGRLGAPRPVLTGIPRGPIHDGGRLAFGPDGYLYASTGETGDRDLAQKPSSLGGKILRITTAGKPAPGNPDPGSPVWTIGHRNVQGLAFGPGGRLWASEFGQNDWDELNLIQKGTNYGWPLVEGAGDQSRFRNPQVVWRTDEASPSGLAYADGHLWMAALNGGRLWRVAVDGAKASDPTDFLVGDYGRLRTVVRAPDGMLWVTTSNRDGRGSPQPGDDKILLVDPR